MLRKWGTLVLLLLITPVLAWAQNTGKLAGTVTDASTGDPLPGANVVLQGTTIGTATDADGNYTMLGIPVGIYDVQASFVGYQEVTVSGVEINSGYTRQLDFELQPGTQLDEIVVEYERPLIQNDAIGAPRVVSGDDIENLPVRGITNVAALQGGVVATEGSENLFIRGGRDEEVSYYVDGVKVLGGASSLGVPERAIQEQEMLIGSIPARYGDAMSGVISISTRSGGSNFFGTIEGITSEVIDPYGYNLGSLSLGGPILGERLNFFISGSIEDQADADPFGQDLPRLTDAAYESLQQTPQYFEVVGADGATSYIPVPNTDRLNGLPVSELEDALRTMTYENGDSVLTGDMSLGSTQFISAPETFTRDMFEFERGKDDPSRNINVLGNITIAPTDGISIRLGASYLADNDRSWSYSRSLYNRDTWYADEDRTSRFYATWRQRLSNNTFYQLQGEYTQRKGWLYPHQFSRDVRDALFYTDVSSEVNQTLSRYWTIDSQGRIAPRFRDTNYEAGDVYGLFTGPGTALAYYEKYDQEMIRFSGSATTQVGLNQLEFGGEFEQRTQRYFDFISSLIHGAAPLAGYYNDIDGAELTDNPVDRYEDLPFEAFVDNAEWYGYDFRGLNEVDNQDISTYANALISENPDLSAFNIAPYQPIYYAGYIQDKIEYRDLVIQLGARVDVFDNNTPVLRDIYATVPVVRAGALDRDLPSTIGSEDVVYFSGDNVVGYRKTGTDQFYDATGNSATFGQINSLGTPRVPTDESGNQVAGLDPSKYEDYEPQVTFMPRIGVSFPVTNQALFFASYNVTSQRPSEQAFAAFNEYRDLSGQDVVSNPRLKPEKTTQYELGFRQRLGASAALQLSGFYRTQENKIRIKDLIAAYPSSYRTYVNEDFTTTKGVEMSFDLRRTRNLAFNANYTLSFAQATGSDSGTLAVIAWRSPSGFYPNFISPASFDRRHSLNASLDYRLGENEGPEVLGARVFQNFGVNLLAVVGSGLPYTQTATPDRISTAFTGDVRGSINDVTGPWTGRLDLKVDRRFTLGGGVSMKAYLWVQNVFDTENPIAVYRATGLADDDGWLATDAGIAYAQSQLLPAAFIDQYNLFKSGPTNVASGGYSMSTATGARIYNLPRRTRLGVLINF